MKVLWTKEAMIQMIEISKNIFDQHSEKAENLFEEIIAAAEQFSDNPGKGKKVAAFPVNQVREFYCKGYNLIYFIKKNTIEILTVLERHKQAERDNISKKIKLN